MKEKKSNLGIVVAGLLIGIFIAAMDNTIVATAMGSIVADLGGLDMFVCFWHLLGCGVHCRYCIHPDFHSRGSGRFGHEFRAAAASDGAWNDSFRPIGRLFVQ
ncbi:hypothetical protein SAMN05421852_11843 [Thermoflavimicrobium dichotomicum]|uniref:Uncharacterized protein n=1 Tax=Thermoflavimicrobium dichotomicum TaxID=46223 RepID=A0A1I3TM34_9BACL|nr:hypothetical protein SAMN05421852_11843 [Thermoflavimicrobium dichotomicum]